LYRADPSSPPDNLRKSESPTTPLYPSLTSYQWVNLFPEIREHLINIFERYTHVLDAELQQRACEYLALAQRGEDDELLSTMCDEMPVFPERESALVNRLHSRGDGAHDKRTWVIGHSGENSHRKAEQFKGLRKGTGDSEFQGPAVTNGNVKANGNTNGAGSVSSIPASQPIAAPAESSTMARGVSAVPPVPHRAMSNVPETMMGMSSSGAGEDIMASLADLDLSGGHTIQEEPLLANGGGATPAGIPMMSPELEVNGNGNGELKHVASLGGVDPALLAPLTVAPNIEKVCCSSHTTTKLINLHLVA
jgi:AP-2 complex subunit alpha